MTALRWRYSKESGYTAQSHRDGPVYRIRPLPDLGRGRSWRLSVDGVDLPEAAGCTLRFVKHYASQHADPSA
jgi:hypothetical protein